MRIYTRGGDDGFTSLADGSRVAKAVPRVEAYGDVDELNAALGVVRGETIPDDADAMVSRVQCALFEVGARLADPRGRFAPSRDVEDPGWLEGWIDDMEGGLPSLHSFIVPGGCRAAALAHLARTTCRRAERRVAALDLPGEEAARLLPFLNRLSDALFVLARWLNHRAGVADCPWKAPR